MIFIYAALYFVNQEIERTCVHLSGHMALCSTVQAAYSFNLLGNWPVHSNLKTAQPLSLSNNVRESPVNNFLYGRLIQNSYVLGAKCVHYAMETNTWTGKSCGAFYSSKNWKSRQIRKLFCN